ncbi:MAG: hypothetical protein Q4D98_08180 [Planctomycetia bacterium]|nr:hypothetical protein [Planctomycetia bacterium]
MASENRTDALKRLHASLSEKFRPTMPTERTVLEHFIYATCLEDASYEAADAAYTAIVHTMSGWNEIRVSSVTELAELMSQLPDPRGTAQKIKRILHAIFEERYAFELSDMQKKNAKESFEKLESIPGATPFSATYTCQVALGRHGIPLGASEKRVLYVLGIIPESELESREISGLNRAISKQDGIVFASLLHKLTAAFVTNPESRKVTQFLRSFAPDFRQRMPKRRSLHQEDTMETPVPETEEHRVRMIDILTTDPDFSGQWKRTHGEEQASQEIPAEEAAPVKETVPKKETAPAKREEKKKETQRPAKEAVVPVKVSVEKPASKGTPQKKPAAKSSSALSSSKASSSKASGSQSSSEPPAAKEKKPVVSEKSAAKKAVPAKDTGAKAKAKPTTKVAVKGAMKPTGKSLPAKKTVVVLTPGMKKDSKPAGKEVSKGVAKGETKAGKGSKSAKPAKKTR